MQIERLVWACTMIQYAVVNHGYRLDVRFKDQPDDPHELAKTLIRQAKAIVVDGKGPTNAD